MQALLWTLSALEVELDRDRRALAKALEGLAPDEQETDKGGRVHRKWKMAKVVNYLVDRSSPEDLDLDDERAGLAKEQKDRVAMENAVRRGELVDLNVVAEELGRAFTAFRQKMLAAPSKLAPNVNPDKPNVARDIIEGEVHRILDELVTHFEQAADRELLAAAGESGEDTTATAEAQDLGVGGSVPATEQRNVRRTRTVPN